MPFTPHTRRLLAYVAMALAVAVGFAGTDAVIRARVDDSRRIERVNCERQNQENKILSDLLEKTAGPTPIPDGTGPHLRQVIENGNARGAKILAQAQVALAATDCTKLTKKAAT